MSMAKVSAFGGAVLAVTAGVVSAAPTISGTLDAEYGSALAVQGVATGFGDNNVGAVNNANGSELDNAYAKVADGKLFLFLGGNLHNFNKLAVFIDNGSGSGQNVITGANGLPGQYTGFTFDSAFKATNFISITSGNNPAEIYVDYSNILTNTGGYAGTTTSGSNGALGGGGSSNGVGGALFATIDNSNTAGVTGASAAGASSVNTGAELSISLAELGNPTGSIRVSVFINGSNHDYMSNQVLGSLPSGTGNLGGNGTGGFTGNVSGINFNSFAGDQFFTVAVPEPASLGLIGMAGLGLIRRRRRA